jgi:hypothetical protein
VRVRGVGRQLYRADKPAGCADRGRLSGETGDVTSGGRPSSENCPVRADLAHLLGAFVMAHSG